MAKKRKILVTSALTYANGLIHFGHVIEAIQADIWVRFQKLLGNTCYYICGSDAHGTPIMIKAKELGMSPEDLVAQVRQDQIQDYQGFEIAFDNYHTTHSQANKELTEEIYQRLKNKGDITERVISQAYDAQENMFLPDRYIKGECPQCHAKDQYGDSCEVCGKTYSFEELINPISVVSGQKPITKETTHYFFKLNNYTEALHAWMNHGSLQAEVKNKLEEWFAAGLKEWDITRDGPYFGFKIPDTQDKYFYVWLDAPIGYIASFKDFCDRQANMSYETFWQKQSDTELYHFVGKDITYFHALFWPAMLMGADLRMPSGVFVHGFLTINGTKMSKSRGTFITGKTYLKYLDPTYLRYYFAAKLNGKVEDIDLNFEDFSQRINADLVGKVVNIASRCAGFINKHFDNQLAEKLDNSDLFTVFANKSAEIAQHYEQREYGRAVREIMDLADKANQYIDEQKPWQLIKAEENRQKVQEVCTTGLNLFKQLMIYLKPITPSLAQKSEDFLQVSAPTWDDLNVPLLGTAVATFQPLLQRVDKERIEQMLEESKQDLVKA